MFGARRTKDLRALLHTVASTELRQARRLGAGHSVSWTYPATPIRYWVIQ